MKLFADQKSLKFAKIEFDKRIDAETLKPIIFQILEHCSDLIELKYCKHMEWLPMLTDTEVSRLCKLSSQRKFAIADNTLSIGGFSLTFNNMMSEFGDEDIKITHERQFRLRTEFILSYFKHCDGIQHLKIDCRAVLGPDTILQTIFQYQVNNTRILTPHSMT